MHERAEHGGNDSLHVKTQRLGRGRAVELAVQPQEAGQLAGPAAAPGSPRHLVGITQY